MPDPVQPTEQGGEAAKPFTDVFGVDRNPDGSAREDAPPAPKQEEKKPEGDKKPEGEKSPEVAELERQLEEAKSSMGGNLSAQRTIIDNLTKELKALKGEEKKKDIKPLHEDIKRVKDLPQADQDAMTDAEKALWDENADRKERENAAHIAAETARIDAETQAETQNTEALARVSTTAQAEAKRLAGGDVNVANEIISNFNEFAGNDKLTDEQVKERIAKAARMIDGFTPPKEQAAPAERGKPAGGTDKSDPYGVSAAVEQAKKGHDGAGYAL